MSDLAEKIQNLEKRLNEFKSMVTALLPFPASRRRKRKGRAGLPPWAQDIVIAIKQLSEQFMDVKEAVDRGLRIDCSHDNSTGADDRDSTLDRPGESASPSLPIMSKQSQNRRRQLRKEAPIATQSAQHDESTTANRKASGHLGGDSLEPTLDGSLTSQHQVSRTRSQVTARSLSSQVSDEAGSPETSRKTRANAALEPVLAIQQARPHIGSIFSLSVEDMGERLVANAMHFIADPAFTDHISIKDVGEVDWARLAISIQPPPKNYDLLGVTYSTTQAVEGAAELRLSQSRRFHFPEFSRAIAKPLFGECLDYLDQLIQNPPVGTIPYYVGPPLHDGPLISMANKLLHPGQELLKLGPIDGLNSPYWHAGEKGSGTAFHCEDLELFSFNVVLIGWKLWIKIRRSHTAKFEAFIRKHWPTNKCDQFVRHVQVIVSPDKLRKEKIEFEMKLAGPGDLILTHPREYHMVVNMTDNFALAINFLPPGKPVVPGDTPVCPECGLYSLGNEGIRQVAYGPAKAADLTSRTRKAAINSNSRPVDSGSPWLHRIQASSRKRHITHEAFQRQMKTKRTKQHAASQDLHDLDAVKTRMRSADKLCKFPSLEGDLPTPAAFSAVAAIWSRPAIDQFCSLVRSTRDIQTHSVQIDVSGDLPTRIEQRIRRIKTSQHRSKLEKFLLRLNQLYLVEDMENSKEADGRLRADTAFIQGLMNNKGWQLSQLKWHRQQGNLWKRLCGGNHGLLCFILLEANKDLGVTLETYSQMTSGDLAMFHALLDADYTKSICSAGQAFQNALSSMAADADFRWEGENLDMYKLPERQLLTLLQPLPLITENIYISENYPDWPRPSGWPEEDEWPIDPTTLVDPNRRRCDICIKTSCSCISADLKPMPRIKDYGSQGRGLQAQIAYEKDHVIGELAGELAPLGTYHDGRTLELVRGDLPNEPSVCQIHCAETGSRFRLLNHHCRPNARFRGMAVSGRYRMMIQAVRAIRDGEQITVNYGPGYWGKKRCPCDAHTGG